MTFFERTKKLKDDEFRRLIGVKRPTFEKMVEILTEEERILHLRRGVKAKLCIEDRLLMTLEYLREYRTIFHISQSYEVAKSTVSKTINWVENTLVKSEQFKLPGRKVLQNFDMEFEVVVVDATESPIERPKSSKKKEKPD